MKRLFIAFLILLIPIISTACGGSDNDSDKKTTKEVASILITSRSTAEASEKVNIKEETVKISKSKTTDPTSATEATTKPKPKKKKKKKKSSTVPTQGQTQAGTYIAVTTAPNGSLKENDLRFKYKSKYINLDDEIDAALKILGEDNSVTELSKTKTAYEYDDLLTIITYTAAATVKPTEKKSKSSSKTKETTETTQPETEPETPEKIEQITITSSKLATQKGAKIGMYATRLRPLYGVPSSKTSSSYTYTSGNKSLVFYYDNNIVTSFSYVLKH